MDTGTNQHRENPLPFWLLRYKHKYCKNNLVTIGKYSYTNQYSISSKESKIRKLRMQYKIQIGAAGFDPNSTSFSQSYEL